MRLGLTGLRSHSSPSVRTCAFTHVGRYCLNDLHKAAGGEKKHQLSNWLRSEQTNALIDELTETRFRVSEQNQPLKTYRGGDGWQGTFVCKELVYAYAMWISPKFNLKVIRAYDTLSMPQVPTRMPIETR
jgi:hypothetical protein